MSQRTMKILNKVAKNEFMSVSPFKKWYWNLSDENRKKFIKMRNQKQKLWAKKYWHNYYLENKEYYLELSRQQ